MADAAYFRAWRAAHPEYRARENARLTARRLRVPRGDRSAEYAARRRSPAVPIPPLHTGHPAFDLAHSIVKRTDGFTILLDPLYDDMIGAAVLAWFEGRDVNQAVLDFARAEKRWRRSVLPLFDEELAA